MWIRMSTEMQPTHGVLDELASSIYKHCICVNVFCINENRNDDMSEYNWCHGPECHEKKTADRVRGVKGHKVLRTRKIPLTQWNKDSVWSVFCSQRCYTDFFYKHWSAIVAIAPRTEPLEIEIEDPKKETSQYGWSHWNIEVRQS